PPLKFPLGSWDMKYRERGRSVQSGVIFFFTIAVRKGNEPGSILSRVKNASGNEKVEDFGWTPHEDLRSAYFLPAVFGCSSRSIFFFFPGALQLSFSACKNLRERLKVTGLPSCRFF